MIPHYPSQERKLCAFPAIEIYRSDVINYMVPLSHQMDFFVPEMKEEVKTDVKEEDSDEDRGTDITGNSLIPETFMLLLGAISGVTDQPSDVKDPKRNLNRIGFTEDKSLRKKKDLSQASWFSVILFCCLIAF